MCEHCGCRGVEPIAELMDEHYALLDDGHRLRRALDADDRAGAVAILDRLTQHLELHVRKEEAGVFTALRERGDYLDEVAKLEGEHAAFDAEVAALDPTDADFAHNVTKLLRDLGEHVERENLGIFPVSVVTLGADGWKVVESARSALPTFVRTDLAEVTPSHGERP
jgi:hemerythrin-like domain-containing protein